MLLKKEKAISLEEDAVYVVRNGEIHQLEIPVTGYGSQEVFWQNDKPCRVKVSASEQF